MKTKTKRKVGGHGWPYCHAEISIPGALVPETDHGDILYKLLRLGMPRKNLSLIIKMYGFSNAQLTYERIKERVLHGQNLNSPAEVITLFNLCLSEVIGKKVEKIAGTSNNVSTLKMDGLKREMESGVNGSTN